MFRLDNILERWAELYEPLKHNSPEPKGKGLRKSFLRIGMIDADSYFVRNFNQMHTACCAYVTHVDAEVNKQNIKQVSYRHIIYMMQKQPAGTLAKTQITDEEGATEARFTTDDMMQDLIAVLTTLKSMVGGKSLSAEMVSELPADMLQFLRDIVADPDYRDGLRGLHIDEAHWGTLPVHLNGWQICGLTIEQTTSRRLCINSSRYSV